MYCEGKLKLMSHNTGCYTLYPYSLVPYLGDEEYKNCLIEVVTKAGLTVQ